MINPDNQRIEQRWKPLGDKPALLLNMAEDSDTGRLFVTDNSKAKTTLVLDIHSGNSPFCSLMRGQECMQGL